MSGFFLGERNVIIWKTNRRLIFDLLKKQHRQGFTLIELLIVIALIGIVTATVFIAVSPDVRFQDARNTQRRNDVAIIRDAVSLYIIDNKNQAFPGLDGSLTMIGTAADGCDVLCGAQVAQKPKWKIFDLDFRFEFIQPVFADDPPVAAWISPTSFTDPNNQWTSEANAYDGNTATFAQNQFGAAGWGQFIEYNLATTTLSDRLRVNVDYLDVHITEVDIDVFTNGAWVDVFQGGNEADMNNKYYEIAYAKQEIDKMRFRYNYAVGGFWYWVYEVEVYQTVANVELPTCSGLIPEAVRESSARLRGRVESDGGEPVEYRFQYGKTNGYGTDTAWQEGGASGDDLEQFVTGLNGLSEYHYRMQLRNSAGTVNCPDTVFTTAEAGPDWVIPTGSSDASGDWENLVNAHDDTIGTFARAYHFINDPVWSEYLTLTLPEVTSDKLRFYARGPPLVAQVDVDVFKDDAWVDAYQGAFDDKAWEQVDYDEGVVSEVRVRFQVAQANQGFYWEIFELQVWQTEASAGANVDKEACLDAAQHLVPKYLAEMPVDPLTGSQERTYYAVKREHGTKRITIVSCSAEGGESIQISE